MSNFNFMSIHEGWDNLTQLLHDFLYYPMYFSNWYQLDRSDTFGERYPFYSSKPSRMNYYFFQITSSIPHAYINHTLYDNIQSMMYDNNFDVISWTYKDLCEYVGEPAFLANYDPFTDTNRKLQYFLNPFSSRILEHVEKILSALRYCYNDLVSKTATSFTRTARYELDAKLISVSEAERIIANELSNKLIKAKWKTGTARNAYNSSSTTSTMYKGTVQSCSSIVEQRMLRIGISPAKPGVFHLYSVCEKDYDEINAGDCYPQITETPKHKNIYKFFRHYFPTASIDDTYFQIGSDVIPPMPKLAPRSPDESQSKEKTYRVGCYWDRIMVIYDIKPDEPDTFLT